jgi:alpha-galactosidase
MSPEFIDSHVANDTIESSWIYEHGWQSWSPAGVYPASVEHSPRPALPKWQTMAFRPEIPAPATGFQGEGILAVIGPDKSADLFYAPRPDIEVASIRARNEGGRVVVSANGEIEQLRAETLDAGLGAIAAIYQSHLVKQEIKPLSAGWCSWYMYWNNVTEVDVMENIAAMNRYDLGIDVVQIDDGYQAEIGDWLSLRPEFGSLDRVVDQIRDGGRTPGLWTAPFLVGTNSQVAKDHPEWLVGEAVACEHHWGQEIRVLDVTHPGAAEHLINVFATLRSQGFDFHKIDFIYAGAMPGRRHRDIDPIAAYRLGLNLIREGLGEGATLLGCGAPLLPSIGLVDAMRISPDVMPNWEPELGDISQPGMRSALAVGRARAWMHGRLWVNDPDCVLVRPEVERPEPWHSYVETLRGMAVSSDPLGELDADHIARTRELMIPADLSPVSWDPWAGPDQGEIHRVAASHAH